MITLCDRCIDIEILYERGECANCNLSTGGSSYKLCYDCASILGRCSICMISLWKTESEGSRRFLELMNEVWTVASGCRYEGGKIENIFVTKELAIQYAEKLVEKQNERYKKWNKEHDFLLYKKHSDTETYISWEASSDYILVSKKEVLTRLPNE